MPHTTIEEIVASDRNFIHACNLLQKKRSYASLTPIRQTALNAIIPQYLIFINENLKLSGHSEQIIKKRVELLNSYYEFLLDNGFDNTFTSQGKLRPTILEEFLYILFKDLLKELKETISDDNDILNLGNAKAYTNLYFTAKNLKDFICTPNIGINKKDQDFAIYRPITLKIDNGPTENVNIPIVSIGAKTYLDKTMLDGSIATAEKIKSGTPYAKYYVVAETYEVNPSVDPVYSRIDQIYVLRKSRRRSDHTPIHEDVIIKLVNEVKHHLTRDWSNVEAKMLEFGEII